MTDFGWSVEPTQVDILAKGDVWRKLGIIHRGGGGRKGRNGIVQYFMYEIAPKLYSLGVEQKGLEHVLSILAWHLIHCGVCLGALFYTSSQCIWYLWIIEWQQMLCVWAHFSEGMQGSKVSPSTWVQISLLLIVFFNLLLWYVFSFGGVIPKSSIRILIAQTCIAC